MIVLIILSGIEFARTTAHHQTVVPLVPKDWTFMVYLDGDCNLEGDQIDAFRMMASVGSTVDINVLVEFDRIAGYDIRYGDWTDCRRFYVTAGMTPTAANALFSRGEINMGDPLNLVDFVTWSVNTYPAEKYALILSDHGDNGGVCEDLTGIYDYLSCWELSEALDAVYASTGVKVDLIGFEACAMGAIEVAYHASGGAETMVASEEVGVEPFPYDDILSDLAASPTMNSTTFAERFVHHFRLLCDDGIYPHDFASLSAFNLTMVNSTVIPTTDVLASCLNQMLPTYCHDILAAIGNTEYTSAPADFLHAGDLYHFAQNIKDFISDSQVQMAAQDVMDAITAAQIAEWHGSIHLNYNGLSIYLPPTEEAYYSRTSAYSFDNFYWLTNTVWDEFLHALFVTYAPGIRSRETLSDVSYTLFDSNADDYLDAVHIRLDVDTTGNPQNVSVQGHLVNASDTIVDTCVASAKASTSDEWCDLNLSVPVEAGEGWYDVELRLYDAYGILEDHLYSLEVAYLPEAMQHNVAVNEGSILQTVVGQGFPAKVNVTVENQGHYPEEFNVTTYANGTAINSVELVISSGCSDTFTIYWNTTGQTMGKYTITFFAEPVEGETDLTNNNVTANSVLFITIHGDVDGDRDVDIYDIVMMSGSYGSNEGEPSYHANCDVDGDGDIDIFDIVLAASNYLESW